MSVIRRNQETVCDGSKIVFSAHIQVFANAQEGVLEKSGGSALSGAASDLFVVEYAVNCYIFLFATL